MKAKDALDLTKQAYDASSAFMDTNYRPDWEYSLRAFRNEHAPGSKYLSDEYKARSRIFRPKTRTIIRKNEAAGAVALFSNMDIVNLTPEDPDDLMNVAATAAMKEVLEFRLSRTIPWFQICMGGLQDAQTTGAVVSYQYWEYQKKNGKLIKDKPCIELRPIENIRLDGGALWTDPVGTSPYFCDIIPMYVCDVRAMMESKDDKTGQKPWKKFDDNVIRLAKPDIMNTLRQARLGKGEDPHQKDEKIGAFDTVWVMRWFMRDGIGDDYTYFTLGTEEMLTDPAPLEDVYFAGVRPYVMGCAILETHKAIKSGVPMLVKPLQQETNDLRNQRLDNVKFVLNKRWIVARGRNVDVQSLVRNVPGGVTLATNPKEDVHESNWPDVTSSAYVEEDRINADMDDAAGNFNPSTKVANNAVNDTLGGSKMAAAGAGVMTDYLLRTVIETWVEPVLRQVVLLEQAYETDAVVLAICAKKARLFPRFGLSQITDDLMKQGVNLNVNVGMGTSNPNERLQRFVMATKIAVELVANAPPTANVAEMLKEIYSNAGYRDGARFWGEVDPRLGKAMQAIKQLQGALKGKQMELMASAQIEQQKLLSNEKVKGAEIQVNAQRIAGDLRVREAELALEQQRIELEKLELIAKTQTGNQDIEAQIAEKQRAVDEAARNVALERERNDLAMQKREAALELTAAKNMQDIDAGAAQVQRMIENATGKMEVNRAKDQAKAQAQKDDGAKKEGEARSSELKAVVGQLQGIVELVKQVAEEKKGRVVTVMKEGKPYMEATVS